MRSEVNVPKRPMADRGSIVDLLPISMPGNDDPPAFLFDELELMDLEEWLSLTP